MTDHFTGSCSCRAIGYTLVRAPMFVHCCHCLDCQKQTGGAFAINALIERSALVLDASSVAPQAVSMPTESGTMHLIYRCPTCEVALWSSYGGRDAIAFVRASTLDAPHAVVPDVHIFTRSKVPWLGLPEGVRVYDEYYNMKAEWPAESWDRRKAALAAASPR
jgi:hypothetical protein